jgi:HK97 family phage portal protein
MAGIFHRFRQRASEGFKAFRFPGAGVGDAYGAGGMLGLSSLGWMLPGSRYDWQKESQPCWLNGPVLAAIQWTAGAWPEAPQVLKQRKVDGTEEVLRSHPVLDLLARPNRDYDDTVLLASSILSDFCAGNAYWYKVRNSQGTPIELQYLPHFLVEPFWPRDGSRFIAGYSYHVGGEYLPLPNEDVVHLRNPVADPLNIRKGLSPLAAELRAVCTDNEAQTFSAALLKNFGVPGVVLTPEDADAQITPEQAEELKRLWRERFTGDGRGDPLGSPARIKVQKVSLSPEELALDSLGRMPAQRICAALRIDPMVLGYPAENKTYANYEAAIGAAWRNMLIPLQSAIDSQLTLQLLSDFTTDPTLRLAHDHTQVAALSEDSTALYKRLSEAVGGPFLTPNEARQLAGFEEIDGGEALYPKSAPALPGNEPDGAPRPKPGDEKPKGDEAKALWAARVRERRLEAERKA